ncbi:MAG: hypothetical protein Q8Q14_02235 [Gemmatimonadales bacterium]|nr:hypothetical protein [Gemmatimonadales bacterium]
MAKLTVSPSNRSKVRLFFVDADLAPGDMHELTNALTSAIRPTHIVTRTGALQQIAPPTPPPANGNGRGASEQTDLLDEQSELADESDEPEVLTPKAPATARRYKTPQIVVMDMNAGGKPFEEFARERAPVSHRDKYLVAATWCQEYAKEEGITPGHILTCYKAADWTFDVTDPAVALRQLKAERLLDAAGRGKFKVNHLGLAAIKKMKPGA